MGFGPGLIHLSSISNRPSALNALKSSARGEQFLNLRRDPPILGLDCVFKYGYRASSPVEEILVKIPARR